MVQSSPALALAAVPVVVRHLALSAGLPALVLLAAVAALASVADALDAVPDRATAAAGATVGVAALGVGSLAAVVGGGWVLPSLAVGVVFLLATAAVVRVSGPVRFRDVLAVTAVVTLAVGLGLDLHVDAFGWYRPLPIGVQSVALVGAGATFAPFGFATRRGSRGRWALALAIVAAPFVVVAPAVPVGGIGPFFVAATLVPWAVLASAAGAVLFALGWAAADRSPAPRGLEVFVP